MRKMTIEEFEQEYQPKKRGRHSWIYEEAERLKTGETLILDSSDGIYSGGVARGIVNKLQQKGIKARVLIRNGETILVIYGKEDEK